MASSSGRATGPILRVLGHACRLGLALVFLLAGFLKAANPEGFGREVVEYGILSEAAAHFFAYLLLPLEIAVGAALLLDYRRELALSFASGLMVMFIGAISYAMLTGQPIEGCGCFGQNSARTPAQTLTEDFGFLAAGLLAFFTLRGPGRTTGGRGTRPDGRRWKGTVLAMTVLASTAFVLASPHLPIDEVVTPLAPGVEWERLGVPLAEMDLAEGAHLVALLGLRHEASRTTLDALNGIAHAGISVVGLYEDDEEAYSEFFWEFGPAFPLYHVTPSDMRALYRRLPRSFALNDGVITATWNGVPTPQDLEAALE